MSGLLAHLRRDECGQTVIEFAIVAPVLLLAIFGGMELAHTAYVKSVLRNAIQDASRNSGLETGLTNSATIDADVRTAVRQVAPNATVNITRTSYQDFSNVQTPEDFTDTNRNGRYDSDECFTDINGNSRWDADRGRTGQGGADDAVLYKVDVSYAKVFPLWALSGVGGSTTQMSAQTTMRNQPYGTQTERTGVQICPST